MSSAHELTAPADPWAFLLGTKFAEIWPLQEETEVNHTIIDEYKMLRIVELYNWLCFHNLQKHSQLSWLWLFIQLSLEMFFV